MDGYIFQSQVGSCENCSKLFDTEGRVKVPEPNPDPASLNPKVMDLERHVRELELELAQTKLALVESECKTQDLTHQLTSAVTEIQVTPYLLKNSFAFTLISVGLLEA